MSRIAPSILAADFADLASEVAKVEPYVDLLHVDVMDGHFVPNITLGPPVVKSLRKRTSLYFDCHLMIENPDRYFEAMKQAGADSCTFHFEVGKAAEHIAQLRDLNVHVGLAVNPDTEFEQYEEFLDKVDLVLVMTIFPGFGGQPFMADVMPKLRQTREAIDRRGLSVAVEVDGGITHETGPVAALHGADTFVAGTSIFGQDSPADAAVQLREAIDAVEFIRS